MVINLVLSKDNKGVFLGAVIHCDNCNQELSLADTIIKWAELDGEITAHKTLCKDCDSKFPELNQTAPLKVLMVQGFNRYVKTFI